MWTRVLVTISVLASGYLTRVTCLYNDPGHVSPLHCVGGVVRKCVIQMESYFYSFTLHRARNGVKIFCDHMLCEGD